MRRTAPFLALLLIFAGLAGGLVVLFQLRLAQGDVFPPYSSLRADPLGTRALHDSLARQPGLGVERFLRPLRDFAPAPARTLLLAGLRSRDWTRMRREDLDAIDEAVRSGGRLVLALRAEEAHDLAERRLAEREAEQRARERRAESGEPERPKVAYGDLKRRWGADAKARELREASDGAVATAEAQGAGLPARVAWRSDVYFALEAAAGWRVLYRRGGEPVLVERRRGRGTIVLAADSYFLSNEALQRDREPALLAWVAGPPTRIVFDEGHLGVVARPGIAALARRYGLAGALGTLVLLAALFLWRQLAVFVPPVAAPAEVALTYHPAAGLEALLRRAVAPAELVATCLQEWRPTAREGDRARVATALAAVPESAGPVAAYNAAGRALRRR